jgi:hypothetical protein
MKRTPTISAVQVHRQPPTSSGLCPHFAHINGEGLPAITRRRAPEQPKTRSGWRDLNPRPLAPKARLGDRRPYDVEVRAGFLAWWGATSTVSPRSHPCHLLTVTASASTVKRRSAPKRPAPRLPELAFDLHKHGGRYWDRTSDLFGVNEVRVPGYSQVTPFCAGQWGCPSSHQGIWERLTADACSHLAPAGSVPREQCKGTAALGAVPFVSGIVAAQTA